MLPFVFYFGGQILQLPWQFTLAPTLPQMQYLPLQTQSFVAPPPVIPFSDGTEKPQDCRNSEQQSIRKTEIKDQGSIKEQDNLTVPNSVRRIQNPFRNIYTNLTNLVLNFIVSKKKVGDLLQRIDSTLVEQRLIQFYKYIRQLKAYFCSYFNIERVKMLVEGTQIPIFDKDFHRIFRIGANYILEHKIPACFLTSKKTSSLLRIKHFNARRQILSILQGSTELDLAL